MSLEIFRNLAARQRAEALLARMLVDELVRRGRWPPEVDDRRSGLAALSLAGRRRFETDPR